MLSDFLATDPLQGATSKNFSLNPSEMMKDEEIHVYKTSTCLYRAAEVSTEVSMLTS